MTGRLTFTESSSPKIALLRKELEFSDSFKSPSDIDSSSMIGFVIDGVKLFDGPLKVFKLFIILSLSSSC